MKKCNIQNMKKWIAALRSGDYKQGTRQLRTSEDTYCCLGVATDVYRKTTKKGEWVKVAGTFNNGYQFDTGKPVTPADRTHGSKEYFLTAPVRNWLGIREHDPNLRFGEVMERATRLNDDEHQTFADIADALEKTYLKGAE